MVPCLIFTNECLNLLAYGPAGMKPVDSVVGALSELARQEEEEEELENVNESGANANRTPRGTSFLTRKVLSPVKKHRSHDNLMLWGLFGAQHSPSHSSHASMPEAAVCPAARGGRASSLPLFPLPCLHPTTTARSTRASQFAAPAEQAAIPREALTGVQHSAQAGQPARTSHPHISELLPAPSSASSMHVAESAEAAPAYASHEHLPDTSTAAYAWWGSSLLGGGGHMRHEVCAATGFVGLWQLAITPFGRFARLNVARW